MISLIHIRKITILAVLLWTAAIGSSWLWNYRNINDQAVAFADIEADANLERNMAFLKWSTNHGGVYLRVNENTRPSPYLAQIPNRDIPDGNGGILTLQNPAASIGEMKSMQNDTHGNLLRITGLKFINPANVPDEWEKKALGIIETSRMDFSEITTINGKDYLRRMHPMIMEEGCFKCHAWTGIKVDELRGGLNVAVPLAPYWSFARQAQLSNAVTHGSVLVIGLAMMYFLSRQIRLRILQSFQYQKKLEHLAYIDPLTSLLNRRHFFELAEEELVRALRYKRPLSILMVDIDKFKAINDSYGHAAGDKALIKLSEILRDAVREIDLICRMGGEEFAILLKETGHARAMEIAERLRVSAGDAGLTIKDEPELNFTISIGVASLNAEAEQIDAIISMADSALYEAKAAGRNRVCSAT